MITRNRPLVGNHLLRIYVGILAVCAALHECLAEGVGIPRTNGTTRVVHLRDKGCSFDLAWINPGSYSMGTDRPKVKIDLPMRTEYITNGFWMGRHEITQSQWTSVMGDNPSYFRDGGGRLPVDSVTWTASCAFAAAVQSVLRETSPGVICRLPTEAEWEYACRAGTTETYSLGSSVEDALRAAWGEEGGNSTHPVGEKVPNGWGLYDMLGNVSEWVSDPRNDTHGELIPSAMARMTRGGSWYLGAKYCTVSFRWRMRRDIAETSIGLRIVLQFPDDKAVGVFRSPNPKEGALSPEDKQ